MEVKEEVAETKDEAGDVKMTDVLAEAVEKTSAAVAGVNEQPQGGAGKKKKGKGKGKK